MLDFRSARCRLRLAAACAPGDRPNGGLVSVPLGRYEVLGLLAKGGMAEILLARAAGVEGFAKLVAIKRLLPQFATNAEQIELFLREARLGAQLQHSNIVQVYDFGRAGAGHFLILEYVHGQDVRSLLRVARWQMRQLPLDVALSIVRDVCSGLHYAHERRGSDGVPLGIVHRDVSPSNIVVSYSGDVKLCDFGVARVNDHADQNDGRRLFGKLTYMSPEQCQGARVDRRSDVFSLGIVLYELTTSRKLFKGKSYCDIIRQIADLEAAQPERVRAGYPEELAAIVRKALSRDRGQRHDTAEQLQDEIEAFALRQGLTLSAIRVAHYMETLFGAQLSDSETQVGASALREENTASLSIPTRLALAPASTTEPLEDRVPAGHEPLQICRWRRPASIAALGAIIALPLALASQQGPIAPPEVAEDLAQRATPDPSLPAMGAFAAPRIRAPLVIPQVAPSSRAPSNARTSSAHRSRLAKPKPHPTQWSPKHLPTPPSGIHTRSSRPHDDPGEGADTLHSSTFRCRRCSTASAIGGPPSR